ncbi:MAG: hypothetical protein ACP5VE_08355 [Chthonomonadales bacterium]
MNRGLRGVAGFLALFAALGASASVPRYDDIMPLSQVRAGMEGYGLTVFRGTRIERFRVRVVAVIRKGSWIVPGHDMILVRMWGGPMTFPRRANAIRGMSGSPIYVHGKIIGAFSQAEPTAKEPLGGVTPIEDMLEAWDPKLPATPVAARTPGGVQTARLDPPIRVGGRTIRRVVYNLPPSANPRFTRDTLALRPCATSMTFTSISAAARSKLASALAPYNVELAPGAQGGAKPGFKGAPLVPGAAFSMMLVTGDISAGATGTVTYRKGNRILGFGHPFLDIGPIEAPLASAYIYDVYPLLAGSYKIAGEGPVVGASTQDRDFSVSGILGKGPATIPISVDVTDRTTGRHKLYHAQAVAHPNLYSALVSATVEAAIADLHSNPGPVMAHVRTTVDADEMGVITRTNTVFDSRSIEASAAADLDEILNILTGNPFYPLGIKSADVKVEIEPGHQTAQIERIFVKEGKFRPGDTVDVGVVLKPYKQAPVTRVMHLTIPRSVPSGRYILQVQGGSAPSAIRIGNLVFRASPQPNPQEAPPTSIRQMVTRYLERETNNQVVARLLLPTASVSVDGRKLRNLPPPIDVLMRSPKTSGVYLDRDDVRDVATLDWVVTGMQTLALNIERRDLRDSPSAPQAPSIQPTPGTPPPASSVTPAASDFSAGADDEASAAYGTEHSTTPFTAGNRAYDTPALKSPAGRQGSNPKGTPAKSAPAANPTAPATEKEALGQEAPATQSEKPVARTPVVWRQLLRTDFAKGVGDGVAVDSLGDMCLCPNLKLFASSSEAYLWSLVADGNGGLYAGTGVQGRILHIDASGHVEVVAQLPAVNVHRLLVERDGTMVAGTGPDGKTFRVTRDGKAQLVHQAPQSYVLALAYDDKGNLFLGTGGGEGVIYRIAPGGSGALVLDTHQQHVMALTVDRAGNLYAGTSGDGIVYRMDPSGHAAVLFSVPTSSVTSLALNSKGVLYAGTAPRGAVYRINPDGSAKTVLETSAGVNALCCAPDDTVYAAAGSTLYAIGPDDVTMPLGISRDVDLVSVCCTPAGGVYAGTGNAGDIYVAPAPEARREGTFLSAVHDTHLVSTWGTIRWFGTEPAGTHVSVQTRSGDSPEPDVTWSPWSAPQGSSSEQRVASPPARFIQYRLILSSEKVGISPTVRSVEIGYLNRNQAPKVSFVSPAGGEVWAGTQTLKWQGSDPDGDALSYDVFYSSDGGAHWSPLPVANRPSVQPSSPPASPSRPRPATVAEVQAMLDQHPDMPAALREQILARTKEANDAYNKKTQTPPQAPPPQVGSPLRTGSLAFDTRRLADGLYCFKVVASDRPANAVGALSADAVSEPVTVCNAVPQIVMLESGQKTEANGSVIMEGVALQKGVVITAVQFRVDGGEWLAAAPADGIFDSSLERFRIETGPLSKGSHSIEVKAFNAAGNSSTDKCTVEVK